MDSTTPNSGFKVDLDYFLTKYTPMFYCWADRWCRRYCRPDLRDDFRQAALFGVVRAARKFDPDRKVDERYSGRKDDGAFLGYAEWWVMSFCRVFGRKLAELHARERTFSAVFSEPTEGGVRKDWEPEDHRCPQPWSALTVPSWNDMVKHAASPGDRDVLHAVFCRHMNLAQAARELGISRERARQRYERGLQHIRLNMTGAPTEVEPRRRKRDHIREGVLLAAGWQREYVVLGSGKAAERWCDPEGRVRPRGKRRQPVPLSRAWRRHLRRLNEVKKAVVTVEEAVGT